MIAPPPHIDADGAGLLFSDRNEVVHRDTANASVRSGISGRKDKSLVARRNSTIEIDRCASFFLSPGEHQGRSGRTDAVVTLLSHGDGSDVTDMKSRPIFRLQLDKSQSPATRARKRNHSGGQAYARHQHDCAWARTTIGMLTRIEQLSAAPSAIADQRARGSKSQLAVPLPPQESPKSPICDRRDHRAEIAQREAREEKT